MLGRLSWMVLRSVIMPLVLATVVVAALALLGVGARMAADPLLRSLPPDRMPTLLLSLLLPLLTGALPMALFAGLVAGVARLESDGAIDAARSLGATPWQLAGPTLGLAIFASAATFVAGAWGEPWGRHWTRTALHDLSGPDLRPTNDPLVFEVEDTVLGATRLESGGVLRDVLLWRNDGAEVVLSPRGRTSLDGGSLVVDLEDGEYHRRLPDGYARIRFGHYRVSMELPLVRHPQREPFELPPADLLTTIRDRRDRGHEIRFHQLALHRRVALPLAVPLLALMAWPLARSRRGGGTARGFLAAMAVAVGYYLLLRLGDHGLRQFHWPPAIAGYLATAVLAPLAALSWRWRWRS